MARARSLLSQALAKRIFAAGVVVCLALTACAPAPGGPAGSSAPAASRAAPKVLTIGEITEPTTFNIDLVSGSAGGVPQPPPIVHNRLAVENNRGEWVAQLARDELSIEKGTWRLNADGTMETTWRLRPEARWHDGTPFTSADLVFTYTVIRDPDIISGVGAPKRLMESVEAPDPHTFVVRWSMPYVNADRSDGLVPIPRHLLESVFVNDRANFLNSPVLGPEFVGLGPFRLVRWEPGSHLEFARFDEYFMGRPAIDTVILRIIRDPATLVANVLADNVDVVSGLGVRIAEAVEVKRRWEGTRNRVIADRSVRVRVVEVQFRPEYARPVNGLTNRTVRQALYQAIDRRELAGAMLSELGVPADSWFRDNDALRPQVESAIPRFPYEPARAAQLLSDAGWSRGGDGVLVHQPSGERFDLEIWNTESSGAEKETSIVASFWKAAGVNATLNIIPAARILDREYRSKLPGVGLSGPGHEGFITDRLHSKDATSAATRWTGSNRGGYSNPGVDAILDQLAVSIGREERIALHRDLLREQLGDVATMPLYWDIDVILANGRVLGVHENATAVKTWNIHEWTLA